MPDETDPNQLTASEPIANSYNLIKEENPNEFKVWLNRDASKDELHTSRWRSNVMKDLPEPDRIFSTQLDAAEWAARHETILGYRCVLHGDIQLESERVAMQAEAAEALAEREAKLEKLRLEANELIAVSNDALLAATSAAHYARDLGWLHTAMTVDVVLQEAVVEALAKLPDDATLVQIERAKAVALANAKRTMLVDLASEAQDAEKMALDVATKFRAKHAAAKEAMAKFDAKDMPSWMLGGMMGLFGGYMLSSFLAKKES